jgi:hypothetical protein
MVKRTPYHSIIGDRGRGDTPNSSDGVVPYWSSHLDGAESEKIVPSGHAAHRDPQAIAEMVRILKKHIAGEGSVEKAIRNCPESKRAATHRPAMSAATVHLE